MNEWSIVNLGDLIDYKKGYAFKSKYYDSDGDNIIVRVSDTTIDSINISTCHKIKSEYVDGLDDYRLQTDDVIIATVGSWADNPQSIVGKVIKVPKEADGSLLNQNAVRLRANRLLDQKYLFYSLRDNVFSSYLLNNAQGSANQASITLNDIFSYVFKLPTLPEQKTIADVLSALDDKIDLLQRQNETLEKMAETLFRQWFIEEAKEDWEGGTLKDEFDFTMGQSPSGASFNEEKIGTPMFQGNADFGFRFPSERVYTTEPKRFAYPLDTLISVRAPVGSQNMAKIECCIGRGVAAFRHKTNLNWYTYVYYKLNCLMDEIKKFNDEGTVFGSISKKDFEDIAITIPNDESIDQYESVAKPLNDKLINNCEQIQTLQNLRDTLLPKLMSGEVRVKLD
ncbi:MAG: restriction endonuclease subunit S [Wohlfahrtiimonas sp.]